uniref:Uncharacterized protein n=1 Tax=Arion vulgaris TaxID=1028688 RepID=A0A0B7AEJ5_9EUPU
MMTIQNVMVMMVLMLGLQEGNAFDIIPCVNQLRSSLQNGMETCTAMTDYLKCVIRLTDIYKTSENDNEMLSEIKTAVDNTMRGSSANCNIDFMSIVNQLREEYQAGLIQVTQNHYSDDATAEDCMNTFTSVFQVNNMFCSQVTPFAKCIYRVTKVYKSKNINYDQLEQNIINEFAQNGIECNIDVRKLIEELRLEMKDGKDSAFIARPFQLIVLLAITVLSMYLSYY